MDPVISQAIATLFGAISTAILMYATYKWGPRRRASDSDDDKD